MTIGMSRGFILVVVVAFVLAAGVAIGGRSVGDRGSAASPSASDELTAREWSNARTEARRVGLDPSRLRIAAAMPSDTESFAILSSAPKNGRGCFIVVRGLTVSAPRCVSGYGASSPGPSTPAALVYTAETSDLPATAAQRSVIGVARDDVTRIRLVTADGMTRGVPLDERSRGFGYGGGKPEVFPVSLEIYGPHGRLLERVRLAFNQ
jgi:hypothetical protein